MRVQVNFTFWPDSFNKIEFDDVVSSPSNNGNGFAIVNNTVGNLRGRGALIKSSDGILAGNTFFNLMYFAMEFAPEYHWQEADFVHNLLVTSNVINSDGNGVWLGIDPFKWEVPPQWTNNYNIRFVDNTVVNVQKSPFTVTSSADILIANTTFVNVLCANNNTEFFEWATPGSLIFLANVKGIRFSGNKIINDEHCKHPSGNYAEPVSMVNATGIQGLQPLIMPTHL